MEYIKRNIWVMIVSAVTVSYLLPHFGSIFSSYLQPLLMLLTFFGTLNIQPREVLRNVKEPTETFISLGIIHLIGPFTVYFLRDYLNPELFLGLILATAIPSGISVIFLSKLFGGSSSRALVTTTISNLISPIVVPIIVLIFAGKHISIDVIEMSLTIIKFIIVPFVAAQFVAKSRYKSLVDVHSSSISIVILFFLIIGIISPVIDMVISNTSILVVPTLIVVFINLLSFGVGYLVGNSREAKISIGISSSVKNYALATVLALSLFNPVVALPSVIYTVVNNVLLVPLQWFIESESHRS